MKVIQRALTDQISQRQTVIRHHPFHLMELRQMRRVRSFIPKHPIDAEHLHGFEPALPVCQAPKQVRGGRGGVRAQEEFTGVVFGPRGAVPDGAVPADGVDGFDFFVIFFGRGEGLGWVW